jgi:hypothetical protein
LQVQGQLRLHSETLSQKKRGVVVNVVLCKLHLNEETGHKAK